MPNSYRKLLYQNINQKWWKTRTTMERILLILTALALLLILIMATMSSGETFSHEEANTCLTKECITAASILIDYMNETANPCDDFYEFACGNFLKEAVILDHEDYIDARTVTKEKVANQIRNILEEDNYLNEPKMSKFPKKYYKSCMNETMIENGTKNEFIAMLRRYGGWPVVNESSWNETEFNWQKTISNFKKDGHQYEFLFSVDYETENTTHTLISIGISYPIISKNELLKGLNNTNVKDYHKMMVNAAVYFGANQSKAEEDLRDSIKFEIQLHNISEKRNSSSYINRTISDLEKNSTVLSWLNYISSISEWYDANKTKTVYVFQFMPDELQEIEDLINGTPKKVLANYLMWRMIASSALMSDDELRKMYKMYNVFVVEERWNRCVWISTYKFRVPISSLYIRKYYKNTKLNIQNLIDNLKSIFISLLKSTSWMDSATQILASKRINEMIFEISHHDDVLNVTAIEEYYKELNFTEDLFLKLDLQLNMFEYKKQKPPLFEDWHIFILAWFYQYSSYRNAVHLPAAVLQHIYFNKDYPNYMNYGAIGVAISQMMTSSLDDSYHSKYYKRVPWWSPNTKKGFDLKIKCFEAQLPKTNISFTTKHQLIQNEGAIKFAYLAYNKWLDENKKEPQLPGFKYNDKQLFWISAGRMFCQKRRDVGKSNAKLILNAFRNSETFSKDYNCPRNSRMNPTKKCSVW